MDQRLLAVGEIKVAVQLDTLVLWELCDIAAQWTMRETYDTPKCTWCWVVEQLLEERVACLEVAVVSCAPNVWAGQRLGLTTPDAPNTSAWRRSPCSVAMVSIFLHGSRTEGKYGL